jgi:glycerol kinase
VCATQAYQAHQARLFGRTVGSAGWHEHGPLEIVSSVEKCIDGAVADFKQQGHRIDSIKAIGITNQRETTVVWDKETGEPLYNAILWTDVRTQALIRKLKTRLGVDKLQNLCGLPLSTYPSVGKLLWLLENEPKVKEAYEKGVLAFGTVDTWLVYAELGSKEECLCVRSIECIVDDVYESQESPI